MLIVLYCFQSYDFCGFFLFFFFFFFFSSPLLSEFSETRRRGVETNKQTKVNWNKSRAGKQQCLKRGGLPVVGLLVQAAVPRVSACNLQQDRGRHF